MAESSKTQIISRCILKALAVLLGLCVLIGTCSFIYVRFQPGNGEEEFRVIYEVMFDIIVISIGCYLIFVAYTVLFKFSVRAIKHASGIIALYFIGFTSPILMKLMEEDSLRMKNSFQSVLISFLPILLLIAGFFVYKGCKRLLIKMTNAQDEKAYKLYDREGKEVNEG